MKKVFAYLKAGEQFKLEEHGSLFIKTGKRSAIDANGDSIELNTRDKVWLPTEDDLKPKRKKRQKIEEEFDNGDRDFPDPSLDLSF